MSSLSFIVRVLPCYLKAARETCQSLTHVQLRLVALWVLISSSRDAAIPTEWSQGKILDVQVAIAGCCCPFSLVPILGITRLLGAKSMAPPAVRVWGMRISPGDITRQYALVSWPPDTAVVNVSARTGPCLAWIHLPTYQR